MAEIYDFVKYQSEKEIEMYISSVEEGEVMCYGCVECENTTFLVTVDAVVMCSECNTIMGGDE